MLWPGVFSQPLHVFSSSKGQDIKWELRFARDQSLLFDHQHLHIPLFRQSKAARLVAKTLQTLIHLRLSLRLCWFIPIQTFYPLHLLSERCIKKDHIWICAFLWYTYYKCFQMIHLLVTFHLVVHLLESVESNTKQTLTVLY